MTNLNIVNTSLVIKGELVVYMGAWRVVHPVNEYPKVDKPKKPKS